MVIVPILGWPRAYSPHRRRDRSDNGVQLCGAVLTIIAGAALRQAWRPSRGVLGWGSVSGVFGASGTLAFLVATGATSLGIAVAIGQRAGIGICTVAVAAMARG